MTKFFCWHQNHTEFDNDGYAICLDCGGKYKQPDPVEDLRNFSEHITKQYLGHKLGCQQTELGWLCKSDCRAVHCK